MSYPKRNTISDLYFQIWIEAGAPEGWFQTRNGIRCAVGLPEEQRQRVEALNVTSAFLTHLVNRYLSLSTEQ
jgi:hypothetical protein